MVFITVGTAVEETGNWCSSGNCQKLSRELDLLTIGIVTILSVLKVK